MSTDLIAVVRRAVASSEPHQALATLVEDFAKGIGATAGRLYLLDLANTAYIQHAQWPADSAKATIVYPLREKDKKFTDSLLSDAITACGHILRADQISQQPIGRVLDSPARSRMIVPLVRDNVCVGLIDLDSHQERFFTEKHEAIARSVALFALLLVEKKDVARLLEAISRPIDYLQPFDQFLDELILIVANASGLPLVALRELRDGSLYLLKSFGFPDLPEESLHLTPVSDYPTFERAITLRQPVVESQMDQESVTQLLDRLQLKEIKSFVVVPVLVGKEVFGTLAWAVYTKHVYTQFELRGLETLANTVGIAITNYRNFHAAEERLYEQAKVGAAITTVDVAQSARHEARNKLQSAQELLATLTMALAAASGKHREMGRKHIDELSQELRDLEYSLQKIKTITKPPEREKKTERLETVWDDAFTLITGRLDSQNIRWHIEGSASARVALDYMRHAFLNLILNSVDAFKDTKKRGRRIDVVIEPASEKAKDITMRYMDNAIGIDPSRLKKPGDQPANVNDIFAAGVTSKVDGSGYGLFLVRKILADHSGSIDLIDHRNGVVFQIRLPKI